MKLYVMTDLPVDNEEVTGYERTLDSMIEELGQHDSEAYALMREGLNKLQRTLDQKGYVGSWEKTYTKE